MAKFKFQETITTVDVISARMGANTVAINGAFDDKEVGKVVKLSGESRYDLAAAGSQIEGFVVAMEPAPLDGYAFGAVGRQGRKEVTFDGAQDNLGVGAIAIGDYVVAGTVVAKGTALTGPVKVAKATNQPGAAVTTADNVVGNINAAIAKVTDAMKNRLFAWRVVSLGSAGTGAVGTTGLIEMICS